MLTDIEIAQQTKLRPIAEIARELGVREEELEPYGRFKAKLNDGLLRASRRAGRQADSRHGD